MVQNQVADTQATEQKENPGIDAELMSMMKEEVGRARNKNIPIIRAFEAIAEKTGLKPNTIRNYYYQYIHSQQKPEERRSAKKGSVGSEAEGVLGRTFEESEIRELMIEVLTAQARGESVRGCVNRLAKGNYNILIRLQNKYRNMVARKPRYVEELMAELRAKGIPYFNPYTKRIVDGNSSQEEEKASDGGEQRADSEDLVALLSQITSNMQRIEGLPLEGFFAGLKDLTAMAALGAEKEKSARDDKSTIKQLHTILEDKDRVIRDLSNKLFVCQTRLNEYEQKGSQTTDLFCQLIDLNRSFLELSGASKVAELYNYTQKLQGCIEKVQESIREYQM